jgi:hypothetical protein
VLTASVQDHPPHCDARGGRRISALPPYFVNVTYFRWAERCHLPQPIRKQRDVRRPSDGDALLTVQPYYRIQRPAVHCRLTKWAAAPIEGPPPLPCHAWMAPDATSHRQKTTILNPGKISIDQYPSIILKFKSGKNETVKPISFNDFFQEIKWPARTGCPAPSLPPSL